MFHVRKVDAFLSDMEPWNIASKKISGGQEQIDQILYYAAESIRILTALLYPIIPYATAKVWKQFGLKDIEESARNGELRHITWGDLQGGTKLRDVSPLEPIFPRTTTGINQIMTNMENETTPPSNPTPDSTAPDAAPRTTTLPEQSGTLTVGGSTALSTGPAPMPPQPTDTPAPAEASTISIDDFAKIELRVAQIVVAERIPKADKLLRLEVDLGPDFPRRQILSGIAEHYTPEELIGRRIVVITNLAPRKMRGLESHGMLLAASDGENGKPILATFAEDIALGSRLK
jgi:methionyl-tRNA synthetase